MHVTVGIKLYQYQLIVNSDTVLNFFRFKSGALEILASIHYILLGLKYEDMCPFVSLDYYLLLNSIWLMVTFRLHPEHVNLI
jgi:hypothetical protein